MQRVYEYKVIKNADSSQITEANLNVLGQQGWKLITLQRGADGKWDAIFMRE